MTKSLVVAAVLAAFAATSFAQMASPDMPASSAKMKHKHKHSKMGASAPAASGAMGK